MQGTSNSLLNSLLSAETNVTAEKSQHGKSSVFGQQNTDEFSILMGNLLASTPGVATEEEISLLNQELQKKQGGEQKPVQTQLTNVIGRLDSQEKVSQQELSNSASDTIKLNELENTEKSLAKNLTDIKNNKQALSLQEVIIRPEDVNSLSLPLESKEEMKYFNLHSANTGHQYLSTKPLQQQMNMNSQRQDQQLEQQLNRPHQQKAALASYHGMARANQEGAISSLAPQSFLQAPQQEVGHANDHLLAIKNEQSFFDVSPKSNGGMQMEFSNSRDLAPAALINKSQQTVTLDLSHIDSQNRTELINRVMQGIDIQRLEKADSLDVFVKHNELGDFRVQVAKAGLGSQVDFQIQSSAREAHQFFSDHEYELLKALDRAGIKVSDLRIMMGSGKEFSHFFAESKNLGSQSSFDSDQNSKNSNRDGQKEGQHQAQDESQKRQELWQYYKESLEAA